MGGGGGGFGGPPGGGDDPGDGDDPGRRDPPNAGQAGKRPSERARLREIIKTHEAAIKVLDATVAGLKA